jgi:hypothetical protein
MIKSISPHKLSLKTHEHLIFVEPMAYDPKTQRVLVSLNNKVAEGIYDKKSNKVVAKITLAPTNSNHPLANLLPQNEDIRVKTFVYDFVKDRILGAKVQEFAYNFQHLEYYPTDGLLSTSPVIIGAWDKKRLVEKAKKVEGILKAEVKKNLISNVAYETDGHYSTVLLVSLMLGLELEIAGLLAKATEAPDTTIHSKTKFELNDTWGHMDGSQQEIHSLTGGFHGIEEFFTAIKFLYTPKNNIDELGKLLHRFGDTYAHTKINNLKPEDIKEDLDLKGMDKDSNTIKKYINSWKIKSEKSLKNSVEPWIKFFNYYLEKDGFNFLNDEKQQKEIFKGRSLKEILKDIYLKNESKDFVMYGSDGYTTEHAFTDGGYPDLIYLRPNWYRIYVQNLAWLIATKYKLVLSKLDLIIFDKMINFVIRNKCSMKGIIDFEISKKLNKNEIYIPVYYAEANRVLASIDELKSDYFQIAKDVCEKTKEYMIEQKINKGKIKVIEIHEKKIKVSVSSVGYASPYIVDKIIAFKITF